jgi:glycerophosphoryl diester phosphodiesterase
LTTRPLFLSMQKIFPRFTIIAHRGASADAPENTLAALRLARQQDAVWAEVDVKLTHDNVPILMHDDTLERTSNGHGAVATIDYAAISQLDAGGWKNPNFTNEHIPTLEQALTLAAAIDLRLNLELKPCPDRAAITATRTCEIASTHWPKNLPPPLLSSFVPECLQVAQQLLPDWPRALIVEGTFTDWGAAQKKYALQGLVINQQAISATLVAEVHSYGGQLLAYTVNDRVKSRDLQALGVDALFTDHPAELLVNANEMRL